MPLDVNSGETHTVDAGTTETYDSGDNEGVVVVEGVLIYEEGFEEEPEPPEETPPFRVTTDRITLPLSLDLPLQPLNLRTMEAGIAVFMIGILAVLGAAAAFLRNYVAGAVLGLAVVSLLMSGTLGIGLAPFWALLIATTLVLIFGAGLRVMAT